MKKFINRIQKLKDLETEYAKNESSLIILYGRRRVGKTALISEFIKQKKLFIFLQLKKMKLKIGLLLKI